MPSKLKKKHIGSTLHSLFDELGEEKEFDALAKKKLEVFDRVEMESQKLATKTPKIKKVKAKSKTTKSAKPKSKPSKKAAAGIKQPPQSVPTTLIHRPPPIVQPPVQISVGQTIWNSVKNRKINLFGLKNQTVSD